MYDRDAVIRHAAEAAAAHATDIGTALGEYIRRVEGSEDALRNAIVATAAGYYKAASHDDSTYAARVAAAKAALEAWDGPEDQMVTIVIGAIRVRCTANIAQCAGWEIVIDHDGKRVAQEAAGLGSSPVAELATALGEGFVGEQAMLRTIVLRAQNMEMAVARHYAAAVAEHEAKTAGMTLAAERAKNRRKMGG